MDQQASDAEEAASPRVAPDTYRALFEQSADAILIIDGETFVDCNQATVDILGFTREELLGKTPWAVGIMSQEVKAREIERLLSTQGS